MANKETYLKYTYGNVGTTIRPSTRLGLGTLPSTYPGASHKISPSPPWASGMPPPFTIPPCFSLPPFGQGRSSLHKRPSRITCTNAEWRGDPSRLRALPTSARAARVVGIARHLVLGWQILHLWLTRLNTWMACGFLLLSVLFQMIYFLVFGLAFCHCHP